MGREVGERPEGKTFEHRVELFERRTLATVLAQPRDGRSIQAWLVWVALPWVHVERQRSLVRHARDRAKPHGLRKEAHVRTSAHPDAQRSGLKGRDRHLDDAVTPVHAQPAVRHAVAVVTHRIDARVVLETLLAQDLERPKRARCDRKACGAISAHSRAASVFDGRLRSPQVFAKCGWTELVDQSMGVTMTCHLVTRISY